MHAIPPDIASPLLEVFSYKNRCYIDPFYSKDPKRKRKDGLLYYRFLWWGRLWEILGFSMTLKGLNGKIYYVDKKDLEKWIRLHHGTKEGTYYERISQICKKQLIINQRKLQNHIIRKGSLYSQGAQKREIKRQLLQKKAHERVSEFVKILKEKADKSKKTRETMISEEGQKCLASNTYRVMIDDEVIMANPILMKTSYYFRMFLHEHNNLSVEEKYKKRVIEVKMLRTFKNNESESQKKPAALENPPNKEPKQTKYSIDDKMFEFDSVDYPINEIDGQAFEILKIFLETGITKETKHNQTEQEENQLEKEVLLEAEKNILPFLNYPSILALYELHQVLDISGIIDIIHRNINFYSQEMVIWENVEEYVINDIKYSNYKDFQVLVGKILAQDVIDQKSGIVLAQAEEQLNEATINKIVDAKIEKIFFRTNKEINCREFWTNIGEKYHDISLKKLCAEKFYGYDQIQSALEKHKVKNRSTDYYNLTLSNSCPITCTMNSKGENNLTLKFALRPDFFADPSTILDAYLDYLKVLSPLSEEIIQKAKLKTITVDVSAISSYGNNQEYTFTPARMYILNLLTEIHNHFDPPAKKLKPGENVHANQNSLSQMPSDILKKEVELVLSGLDFKLFEEFSAFNLVLNSLLSKFSRVTLMNIPLSSDAGYGTQSIQFPYEDKLEILNELDVPLGRVEALFHLRSHSTEGSFSISLQEEIEQSKNFIVNYTHDNLNLLHFNWIPNNYSLTLRQCGEIKKPWNAKYLSMLQVNKLIIENSILNDEFVEEISYGKKIIQMNNLDLLILKNCEMEEKVRQEICKTIEIRNSIRLPAEMLAEVALMNSEIK